MEEVKNRDGFFFCDGDEGEMSLGGLATVNGEHGEK